MNGERMKVAKLDDGQLLKVQMLEKQLGCCVVAMQPEKSKVAKLTPAQVKEIASAEKQLGMVLVAYEA